MLILVPWKPFVFGWLLLTAMILAGYAVYCLQEGRNPFSIEKYHLQGTHSHHTGHGKRGARSRSLYEGFSSKAFPERISAS